MSDIEVSIVVVTKDRTTLLAETLASCLGQQNRTGQTREIVVIDNHASQSGRPVVEGLAALAAMPIRYVADPVRNASALLNRGFAEAAGRWVAFIDDDEVADHDWLDELTAAVQDTGAAIAIGARLVRFANGKPPSHDPTGAHFARDLGLPDRAKIDLVATDGKPNYGIDIGNSVFDVRACFEGKASPVRQGFGRPGVEDAELFVRMHREGRKIVWAAKAFVTETVPRHRTTVAHRLSTARHDTQHYVSLYLDAADQPWRVRLATIAKGVLQALAGLALALVTGEFGSEHRLKGRLLMAQGVGKLTWR
jgi:succinoglycan biosynthesis protein ExoM